MAGTGLWLRIFVSLLIAVLPPIVMLVVTLVLTESVLDEVDPNTIATIIVAGAIAWAALLGIIYTRTVADEYATILKLARRGQDAAGGAGSSAHEQLAASLDERNRQVSRLADQAALIRIDDEPQQVGSALASAVRSVMQDPTWRLVVLDSEDSNRLPAGLYHATEDERSPDPVGEVERWASVSGGSEGVARIDGPWGAFVVVNVASNERVRAILLAPWEGRHDPAPAERNLLTLVARHAETALEHSLLYARVRSQADELNRLAGVQADFLRGVTHDLQTPLTSIGAAAAELRASEGMSDEARADLDTIGHQADRLRRLVGQLLIASRLEAGAFTPNQDVFAVPPIIERTWAALRADRPFDLRVEGRPHLAVADQDRLEQVLWALLDNAVKYSPRASPIIVRVTPDGHGLRITVLDQGAGMDQETRSRAIEQFYRSPEARRLAPDGSGVGLYAAHGIMAAMGGRVDIDSALGRGTSVTLWVPAEDSAAGE